MFRVSHLSYSESGGAGNVATNLNRYFSELSDVDSTLNTVTRTNIRRSPLSNPLLTLTSAFDNFVVKKNNFTPLFSLYRNGVKFKGLYSKESHIFHFHWMAGLLNDTIKKIIRHDNPIIVWTLHDMEPYTGGCHYSLGCNNFVRGCSDCPAVKINFRNRVSNTQNKKLKFLRDLNNIALVSPANWGKVKISQIEELSNKKIHIIPNPVDDLFFEASESASVKEKFRIPNSDFVIGFVSDQINNPLKNFNEFIEIIEKISAPKNKKITLLIVGSYQKKIKIRNNFSIIYTGKIGQRSELKKIYAVMDLLISTSIAETFGLTVAEASAVGIPSLVKNDVAAEELVEDGVTGFTYKDTSQAVFLVSNLLRNEAELANLKFNSKVHAQNNWTLGVVGKQYHKLYLDLINSSF